MVKELYESLTDRLHTPIISSILISSLLLNWRAFFYLLVANKSVPERIEKFDALTSTSTLIITPIIIGSILAATMPWLKVIGAFLSQKPLEIIKQKQLDSEEKAILHREALVAARRKLAASQEEGIIEQAKRDEDLLSGVTDTALLKATQDQLKELREKTSSDLGLNEPELSEEKSQQIKIVKNRIERIQQSIEREDSSEYDKQQLENEILREWDKVAKIKGMAGVKLNLDDEIPF